MSDGAPNLLQQVNDYLLQVYQAGKGASPSHQQLAFEPIGTPISADMFKLNSGETALSPAIATEVVSALTNVVPEIDNGTFRRGLRTLEACYEIMLYGATPLAPNDGFAHVKAEAEQTFDDQQGSLQLAAGQYRPVAALPSTWYDGAQQANWTTKSFTQASGTQTGAGSDQPTSGKPINPRMGTSAVLLQPALQWQLLPQKLTPILAQRQAFFANGQSLLRTSDAAVRPKMMMMFRERFQPRIQSTIAATNVQSKVVEPTVTKVLPQYLIVRPLAAAQTVAAMATVSTPQHVATQNLSVTFDYCMVQVHRPWLSEAFLQLRNWYVAGYRAGELSSGSDVVGAGNFGVVPTAFIAIKNLAIHADWSTDDKTALESSVSMGPFSLVGRGFDQATNILSCPGMQLVAWVCESQPCIPPASDPSLPQTP